MALTQEQITKLRDALTNAARPLILHDDDPDGLTSFLLLYKMNTEAKGVMVKSTPRVDVSYLEKVKEYQPDVIFILDMPQVQQEFINKAKVPVYWIDHHQPQDNTGVYYCNPRVHDDNDSRPTNYWAYQVTQDNKWISLVGCLADWFFPEFAHDFPDLIPDDINRVEDALFTTTGGKLARVFSFILKGKSLTVSKCIKTMTRIKHYSEILEQSTPQGKFIWKRFEKVNKEYENLINSVGDHNVIGDLVYFQYDAHSTSFTSDLSNEIQYKYPQKVVLICREKSGEMKCSMRAQSIDLAKVLEKSLVGINGYGGGHKHACGACIKSEDFEQFKENLVNNIAEERANQ